MKNVDEIRNYFLEDIKQNELISGKHKNAFTSLNYTEHFLILVSTITACISFSAFVLFFSISAIGFCVIATGIKTNKSQ